MEIECLSIFVKMELPAKIACDEWPVCVEEAEARILERLHGVAKALGRNDEIEVRVASMCRVSPVPFDEPCAFDGDRRDLLRRKRSQNFGGERRTSPVVPRNPRARRRELDAQRGRNIPMTSQGAGEPPPDTVALSNEQGFVHARFTAVRKDALRQLSAGRCQNEIVRPGHESSEG